MQLVGSYLGRSVLIDQIEGFAPISQTVQIPQSLVCAIFDSKYDDSTKACEWLSGLLALQPLAAVFQGNGSAIAFDRAIRLQASPSPKHTMTKHIEEYSVEAAVEDFLKATWPDEDRFAEWVSYVLLVIGSKEAAMKVEGAARKFLDH